MPFGQLHEIPADPVMGAGQHDMAGVLDPESTKDATCAAAGGLSQFFTELSRNIERHFAEEEALMRTGEWPESKEHIRQHGDMLNLVHDIEIDLRLGRVDFAISRLHTLMDRLASHTVEEAGDYLLDNYAARA